MHAAADEGVVGDVAAVALLAVAEAGGHGTVPEAALATGVGAATALGAADVVLVEEVLGTAIRVHRLANTLDADVAVEEQGDGSRVVALGHDPGRVVAGEGRVRHALVVLQSVVGNCSRPVWGCLDSAAALQYKALLSNIPSQISSKEPQFSISVSLPFLCKNSYRTQGVMVGVGHCSAFKLGSFLFRCISELNCIRVGWADRGLNVPTKRSSGHKKLNPFFMTEAEFKRTDGGREPCRSRSW